MMATQQSSTSVEDSIRNEYQAMWDREAQRDGADMSGFISYDAFRAQRLKDIGLPANVDASKYTETFTANGKNQGVTVTDPNGGNVYSRNWVDDWGFWKDFGIPAVALVGAALTGGTLAAAGGAAGAGGAAAGGAGAAGGSGAVGAGGGGLLGGAGATGAGIGAVDATLPTVFVSGSSAGGLGALSAGQVAALGGAGAGALGGLSSADKAALYGNEGYGPGMSGAQTSLYDGILNVTGSPGLASGVTNSSIGSGLSSLSSSLGGWGNLASLAGGLLGGTQSTTSKSSVQNQIDPRMAAYLYGSGYGDKNSLIGAAQALYNQNRSGLNQTMQQGLDMQKAALTDPAYGQVYTDMRNVGSGLLNAPVAANPFSNGQASLSGGLLGGNAQSLINRGRGLLG